MFVVRLPERARVLAQLKAASIGAGVHYPVPVHLQPAYAHLGYRRGSFPHAERAAQEVLSLPVYLEISEEQIGRVVERLKEGIEVRPAYHVS